MSDSESEEGPQLIESVWEKFEDKDENGKIECKVCFKSLVYHGNTTNAWKHLKTHGIEKKRPCTGPPTKKQKTLMDYAFQSDQRNEIDMMYTEMVVKGLSFYSIANCKRLYQICLRASLKPLKDPNSIRDRVMKIADQEIDADRARLKKLIENGHKFVLTLDEWSSNDTRRFMSIVLHVDKKTELNLGLVRVRGLATAENLIETMNQKLQVFGLHFERDIIGINTDGSRTMIKFGQLLSPFVYHQICVLHSLQLAVIDTLYNPNLQASSPLASQPDENSVEQMDDLAELLNFENEDGDLNEAFEQVENELDLHQHFNKSIGPSIASVRKIVTMFHKSGKNQEVLEQSILGIDKTERQLTLIMDVRTRWSSLYQMLARFVKLIGGIKIALIKLKKEDLLDEIDLDAMREVVEVLQLVKLVVDKLSSKSTDLLEAHLITDHLIKSLSKFGGPLAEFLVANLEQRLAQRSGIQTAILVYLSHNELIQGIKLSEMKQQIIKYFKRFEQVDGQRTDEDDTNDENNNERVELKSLDFNEQLNYIVMNKEKLVVKEQCHRVEMVKRELAVFQKTNFLGENLRLMKQHLEAIKPSSIASERTFSVAGLFKTKLRSRLGDSVLNKLVYLKYKFLNGDLE